MTVRGSRWIAKTIWWIFANAASPRFGTAAVCLVLARSLNPDQFGVVAAAVVALLSLQSLEQLGVGRAMAAWRGDLYQIAPTVTAISAAGGVLICAAGYLAGPAYARLLGQPAAATPIRLLTISVLASALTAAPAAVLQQRSPRATNVLVKATDSWVAVAVAAVFAVNGHAQDGLVAGRIAGSAVGALLCVAFAPRAMRLGFDSHIARIILRAGLPLAAFSVLLFAVGNADLIVVGHLLPAPDLGYYFLAVCLATWPITLCTQPVRDHAPATFARLRASPQIVGSAYWSAINMIAWFSVPVCVLLICSGGSIVRPLYGSGWTPVAELLAWLAPLAALRICGELSVTYIAARASLAAALAVHLTFVIALIPVLLTDAHREGITGVGPAQVLLFTPLLLLSPVAASGSGARRFLTSAARILLRFAVLLAVGWFAFVLRHGADPAEQALLVVAGVFWAGAMFLVILRNRRVFNAVRQPSRNAARWSLAPDSLAALTTSVRPMRYPALTLIPMPAPFPSASLTVPPARAHVREAPDDEKDSLGGKVRVGAAWSTLNTLVLRIANFAVTALLARTVFGPKAFGLYAVSQVVLALLLSANEMGVSLAIVRWDADVRSFARTVYTLAVASSTLFYGILYVIAPEVARTLGSPAATGMVRLICLCVIIDGLACVQLALLTRTFAQSRLMLVNALNFVVSTGITLWLAFAGVGPISFAWGSVAGCLVALVAASIAAPFIVLPGWNTGQAKELLRFGLPLAGASLLLLGVYNVDSVIVGATLGPAALGLYALAFNISSWPVRAISEAARRVSFAGFSRVADSPELLTDAYARAIGLVMAAAVPACVLLGTLAEPLIRFIYGPRWVPAAPVLTLLAALGLLRVIYEISYDCLAAAGRRPALLAVQGWWLATLCPVLLVGAHLRGIVGVGAGHIVVAGLFVGPAFGWALSRCSIPIRTVLAACVRPIIGGILMTVFCEVALYAVGHQLAGVVLAGAAGIAVYLPVVVPMRTLVYRSPSQSPPLFKEETAA